MMKIVCLAALMAVAAGDPMQGLYKLFLSKPEGFSINSCETSGPALSLHPIYRFGSSALKCSHKLDQCGMTGRPALVQCCTPFAIGTPTAQTELAKSACEHAKRLSKKADEQETTVGEIVNKGATDRRSHLGQVRFLRAKDPASNYFCGGRGGCPRGVGLSVDCSVTGGLKCGEGITCCNSAS